MENPALTLRLFMTLGVNELTTLRDSAFADMKKGVGSLVRSSVNGSSFEFAQAMSPQEIAQFAQLAIEYKAAGLTRGVTRTVAAFL
jgi:hypothetical protein